MKLTKSTIFHRCDHCSRLFNSRFRVEEHGLLKHGGPQAKYTSLTYDEHHAVKEANISVRRCHFCHDACVVFTSRDDLREHLQRYHPKQKCDVNIKLTSIDEAMAAATRLANKKTAGGGGVPKAAVKQPTSSA